MAIAFIENRARLYFGQSGCDSGLYRHPEAQAALLPVFDLESFRTIYHHLVQYTRTDLALEAGTSGEASGLYTPLSPGSPPIDSLLWLRVNHVLPSRPSEKDA